MDDDARSHCSHYYGSEESKQYGAFLNNRRAEKSLGIHFVCIERTQMPSRSGREVLGPYIDTRISNLHKEIQVFELMWVGTTIPQLTFS